MTVRQVPMDEFVRDSHYDDPWDIRFKPVPDFQRPRPISQWTKETVLEMCRCASMPVASMQILDRMTLEDIRATCLVYVGTFWTGSRKDQSKRRHTRFWRLDYDYIRELGGVSNDF